MSNLIIFLNLTLLKELEANLCYRKQFLLIVAYAVTIHKCLGLSLDTAIIDLSSKVFSPRMVYVSLNGLHLTDFDPASIIVSNSCLEEINRLRTIYRADLPLYNMPKTKKASRKRHFNFKSDEEVPPVKKPRANQQNCKQKNLMQQGKSHKTKKAKTQAAQNNECIYTGTVSISQQCTVWHDLRFYPVNEERQRQACNILGLQFIAVSNCNYLS